MSHILSAWVYIADSKQGDLTKGDSFFTLSDIIRNIIDGRYNNPLVYLELVQFRAPEKSPMKAILTGISLWNNQVKIYNRWDVVANIRWREWKIGVLYELDGQELSLDLSEIRSITQEKVHKLIQPEDMIGTLIESQRSFSVQSSDSGLAVSMH